MSNITSYQSNLWLAEIQTVWLALHSSNPSINGELSTEVNGRGYERISVNFTDPDQGVIWSKREAKFSGMPSTTVAFIAGWNKQYNGKMLWYATANEEEKVQAGQSYLVKEGSIAVSIG